MAANIATTNIIKMIVNTNKNGSDTIPNKNHKQLVSSFVFPNNRPNKNPIINPTIQRP